jgi:2-polyprenyl-3-methyl-5-hydroxy-6-metoxy-1,4-benzoquinol methylase
MQVNDSAIVGAYIDRPRDDDLVHAHGFGVLGWFFDGSGNAHVQRVEARLAGRVIGASQLLFDRPDVRNVHGDQSFRSGFELPCVVPEELRSTTRAQVEVWAVDDDGGDRLIGSFGVRFSSIDYRIHGHGYLVTDEFDRVLHRGDVYGSGPPSPVADPRCVDLVLRYIDHTANVLDIGSGIGAYGKELRARGIAWHGVEVVPEFCARMTAEGLPNTLLTTKHLPFADKSFESGISIEVLEHIADYEGFLAEIVRVVRGTVCFSVPNAEGIPLLSYMHALPWHMLESDHKNFFSRASLRQLLSRYFSFVEVFTYGNLPNIKSYEGIDIPNHLFAVARPSAQAGKEAGR